MSALGALRCAFFEEGWAVVCDLCSEWALASECRDCRAISPDLSKVCDWCCREMSDAEDAIYDDVREGY